MDVHDPLQGRTLAAIDPDGNTPSRLEKFGQSEEGPSGIGRVIDDTDRVNLVETPGSKWRVQQVSLDDGDLRPVRRQLPGCHDRTTQVDANQQRGCHLGGDSQVAPHAATAVKHNLSGEICIRQARPSRERGAVLLGPEDPEPVPLQLVSRLCPGLIRKSQQRGSRGNFPSPCIVSPVTRIRLVLFSLCNRTLPGRLDRVTNQRSSTALVIDPQQFQRLRPRHESSL